MVVVTVTILTVASAAARGGFSVWLAANGEWEHDKTSVCEAFWQCDAASRLEAEPHQSVLRSALRVCVSFRRLLASSFGFAHQCTLRDFRNDCAPSIFAVSTITIRLSHAFPSAGYSLSGGFSRGHSRNHSRGHFASR